MREDFIQEPVYSGTQGKRPKDRTGLNSESAWTSEIYIVEHGRVSG